MSPITSIQILWSESNECPDGQVYYSLDEANAFLRRVARKEKGKIGYCKVKYKATFADGEEYTGRADVTEFEGHCFLEEMRRYISFLAGLARPGHFTEEQYRDYVKDSAGSAEIKEWVARLGVEV